MASYKVFVFDSRTNGNVNWNENSENRVFFKNEEEKENFFKSKYNVPTRWYDGQYVEIYNFNLGDGLKTQMEYYEENFIYTSEKLLNSNYLIVRFYNSDDGTGNGSKSYFYFIKNAFITNKNTVHYDLFLDVLTTYNLGADYNFLNPFVERKHFDRWTEDSTLENAKIDFSKDFFQIPENMEGNYELSCSRKERLQYLKVDGASRVAQNKLDSTIWALVFSRNPNNITFGSQTFPYTVYTVPFNNSFTVEKENGSKETLDNNLINVLNTDTNVFSICLTTFPPITDAIFYFDEEERSIKIKESNFPVCAFSGEKLIEFKKVVTFSVQGGTKSAYALDVSKYINYSSTPGVLQSCSVKLIENSYNLSTYDIIENDPKIFLRRGFYNFKLKNFSNAEGLSFDLSNIVFDENGVEFIRTSSFSNFLNVIHEFPLVLSKNGGSRISQLGLTFSRVENYQLPIFNDAFKQWFISNQSSMLTGLMSIPAGNHVFEKKGNKEKGNSSSKSEEKGVYTYKGYEHYSTIDNIKNFVIQNGAEIAGTAISPQSIRSQGKSTSDFNIFLGDNFSFLEVDSLKEADKKTVSYFLNCYGYSLGRNFKGLLSNEDFFTRECFNYIKLSDCESSISWYNFNENVKKELCTILNNGVRFWESNNFTSFNIFKRNIEKRLV